MLFLRRILPLILLTVILASIYGMTIAPDITWANFGGDGGDFVAAAATGGIAHPPGYPTYLVLARLFQLLPFGKIAFRTNLLSAVCAIMAALLVAGLVERISKARKSIARWSGFVAGLAFGLTPLYWSQAVITEVYTLNAIFVVLILWVLSALSGRWFLGGTTFLSKAWLESIGGLIFGLALGNHLTVVLLLPPWLMVDILHEAGRQTREKSNLPWRPGYLITHLDWYSLVRRVAWLLLGLTVYLAIPLRARSGSPIMWGDPTASTWEHFWWLVSAQVYQDFFFTLSIQNFLPKLGNWAQLLLEQFGYLGLLFSALGLMIAKKKSHNLWWVTVYIFISFSVFTLGYTTFDWQFYLIPALIPMAMWLGWGVAAVLESSIRFGHWITPIGVGLLCLGVLGQAWAILPEVDASHDFRAVEFAKEVLTGLPQDAIIYTEGAEETFTLWYYHFVLGDRPDIVVIDKNLLGWHWHRQHLRQVYPNLVIPEHSQGTWPVDLREANDRQVCDIGIAEKKILYCIPE
jgi:hypothetical protein